MESLSRFGLKVQTCVTRVGTSGTVRLKEVGILKGHFKVKAGFSCFVQTEHILRRLVLTIIIIIIIIMLNFHSACPMALSAFYICIYIYLLYISRRGMEERLR